MAQNPLALLLLLVLAAPGCRMMPIELNLGPVYRHRLDGEGDLVALDFLWPIFHFERLEGGGHEFRVRPLYRRVSRPDEGEEHQFLFPLGRAASDREESSFRLFPLVWWRLHRDEQGGADVDWTVLLPFFWGGVSDQGEDYFAFWPLYGRIPQFLTYDEVGWFLFPLRVWSEKGRYHTRSVVWPLAGEGWGDREGDASWFRILPFHSRSDKPGEYWHRSWLWPLFTAGAENLGGQDPRRYWFLFPLFGRSRGPLSLSWTLLWPFFRYQTANSASDRWDGPWPFFRYVDETKPDGKGGSRRLRQWWLMPFFAATDSEAQWSRVILFPLIWLRRFQEPALESWGTWLLPFFWYAGWRRFDGYVDATTRLFPLLAVDEDNAGRLAVRVPDPIPWRLDSGEGCRELYDFLWNLCTWRRDGERTALTTPANLLCHDRVAGTSTWSVPVLFHTERTAEGRLTLRLFHLFPIRL